MPAHLEISLTSRTPVWTGDIRSKCPRIKESGIIGSLRYWYEILLRGLGFWACDSLSHSCQYNAGYKNEIRELLRSQPQLLAELGLSDTPTDFELGFFKKDNQNLVAAVCNSCRLFGCNGLSGGFRLDVRGGVEDFDRGRVCSPSGRDKYYFFDRVGMNGTLESPIKLQFVPLRQLTWDGILLALYLAVRYGGLGAKTQIGYGQVDFGPENVINALTGSTLTQIFQRHISTLKTRNPRLASDLPRLDQFFFAEFTAQTTPLHEKDRTEAYVNEIRYPLRQAFRPPDYCGRCENNIRHVLCGKSQGANNQVSLLNTSWPELESGRARVWGWIPGDEHTTCRTHFRDRHALLDAINTSLPTSPVSWHEPAPHSGRGLSVNSKNLAGTAWIESLFTERNPNEL